jgi:hypothetical protein
MCLVSDYKKSMCYAVPSETISVQAAPSQMITLLESVSKYALPAAGEAGRVDDVIKSSLAMMSYSSIVSVQDSSANTVSIAE